jgi:SMC interacting uncharacterized protein involved in chromosome segregation
MSEEQNYQKKLKIQKKFPQFTEMVDAMSVEQLEDKLNVYAKEQEKVKKAKEDDVELNKAKDLVSDLSAPYNDAKKAIELKMSYIIMQIGEKGGDAENDNVKEDDIK